MNYNKLLAIALFSTMLVSACNNENQQTTTTIKDSTPIADTSKAAMQHPAIKQDSVQHRTVRCLDIIFEILESSDRYKAITKNLTQATAKNGGTWGISLEASPNPKQDSVPEYSKTYDFNLHESYPDRNVTTGRFSFDKEAGKLFEYDVAADAIESIEFDNTLLKKLKNNCN